MRTAKTKPTGPITPERAAMLDRLRGCTFAPASPDKRFVRDVGGALSDSRERGEPLEITEEQGAYIDRLFHRYRRQITGKA